MARTIIIIIVYIEYRWAHNGNVHVMKIDFRCGCVFDPMVYSRLFSDLSSTNDDAKPNFFCGRIQSILLSNSWVNEGVVAVLPV